MSILNPYQGKCIIKYGIPNADNEIDQKDWIWPEADHGGWIIPKNDWINTHSKSWFRHVKKYDLAVQAGGCCGMYPRLLAEKFQVVYTFEPSPLNFYCLVNNCQEDNIVKIQAALGHTPASIQLQINEGNVGMNKIKYELGYFPIVTLDSFDLPACDLIAFDLEETEHSAICGAFQTIERHKPVIIVENGDKHGIPDLMRQMGYASHDKSGMDVIYVKP